jgi:hypothetical protein
MTQSIAATLSKQVAAAPEIRVREGPRTEAGKDFDYEELELPVFSRSAQASTGASSLSGSGW